MKLPKCLNENCRIPISERVSIVLKSKKTTNTLSKKVVEKVKKAKKIKSMKPEENAIFALNDDCFIEIFRYMNMHDLVNLVKASSQFQPNACTAFGLKYRHKALSIFILPDRKFVMRLDHVGLHGEYTLAEMKRFFRDFGAAISNLEIEHGQLQSNVIKVLLKSICKHSAKTLTCLRFDKVTFTPKILSCLRPLRQTLNKLVLYGCDLYELPNLFRNFPNLNVLELFRSSINPEVIQFAFPNLREFSVCSSRQLKNDNLIEFIRQNPQLTAIDVRYCRFITEDIFEAIGHHLTTLSELHIEFNKNSYTSQYQQFPLNVHNLQRLSLVGFLHLDTYLNEMAPNNSQLQSIDLHDLNDENQIKNVIDCIGQYKNITRLQFHGSRITSKHVQQIARKVPKLMEIMLTSNSVEMFFDFKALVGLVDNCKELTVLKLTTPRVKTLLFNCETLHEFVDVIGKRTEKSKKTVYIYSRDSINIKVPTDHLVIYRNFLKIETKENAVTFG